MREGGEEEETWSEGVGGGGGEHENGNIRKLLLGRHRDRMRNKNKRTKGRNRILTIDERKDTQIKFAWWMIWLFSGKRAAGSHKRWKAKHMESFVRSLYNITVYLYLPLVVSKTYKHKFYLFFFFLFHSSRFRNMVLLEKKPWWILTWINKIKKNI